MPSTGSIHQADVGEPRFAACITTVVLVIALIVPGVSTLAAALTLAPQVR